MAQNAVKALWPARPSSQVESGSHGGAVEPHDVRRKTKTAHSEQGENRVPMKSGTMPGGLLALTLVVFTVGIGAASSCSRAPSTIGGHASMQIQYLEIVTKDVDEVCAAYSVANGVQFGEPDPGLGHARTAALAGGGLVGVRAPLRETEAPRVRPYWLVDDIEAAVAAVERAGGTIAHPPLAIAGHGTFAIYVQGGIEHGFWQR
jgi:uncharacterized protein